MKVVIPGLVSWFCKIVPARFVLIKGRKHKWVSNLDLLHESAFRDKVKIEKQESTHENKLSLTQFAWDKFSFWTYQSAKQGEQGEIDQVPVLSREEGLRRPLENNTGLGQKQRTRNFLAGEYKDQ